MTLEFQPRPAVSLHHDQFEVSAPGLGRYVIDVSLPPGYESSGKKYPVILVVDGNLLFDTVQTQVHGRFNVGGGVWPPSIIVGVGYPADEGFAAFYARRNFDFHGPWAMTDPLGQTLQQIFGMLKTGEGRPDLTMTSGGYDRFIAFLRDELLPALAEHYPIDSAARHTLVGDSSGGHFALRALYDPASPFRRIVCISPGFGSAEGSIQRAEAEYAARHQDLDVDLFICCGKVEVDQERTPALCRFGSGVVWVAEQFAIREWPSARVEWEIMNNEDHASIQARAVAAGLRSVHRVRPGVHDAELKKAAEASQKALTAGKAAGG
jgi:predicted alpha/beta superfamily hydrolase